jgi:hypothetical protein
MGVRRSIVVPIVLTVIALVVHRQTQVGPFLPTACSLFAVGCYSMPVGGYVKPGYEAVRTKFQQLLDEGSDVSASFAAYGMPS